MYFGHLEELRQKSGDIDHVSTPGTTRGFDGTVPKAVRVVALALAVVKIFAGVVVFALRLAGDITYGRRGKFH